MTPHEEPSLPSRADLVIKYSIFRYEIHGPKGYRTTTSTNLFHCALGDIDESAWFELARKVVDANRDNDLLKRIIAGVHHSCNWLRTEQVCEHYALDLYCSDLYQSYLLENDKQHEK